MQYRSSNVLGWNHFQGAVVAGVGSSNSIALELEPVSTGSTAWLRTRSDDTNANIGMRAQGAGTVTLGDSSNGGRVNCSSLNVASSQVILGSTASSIVIGNSTRFLTAIQGYVVQFTIPAIAASALAEDTYAVTGLSTNSLVAIKVMGSPVSTQYLITEPRCSTANELVVKWHNRAASTIGSAGTTGRFQVVEIRF